MIFLKICSRCHLTVSSQAVSKLVLILLPAVFLTGILGAQTIPAPASDQEVELVEIEFVIPKQKTRESALRRWITVNEGDRFENDQALQTAVDESLQELENLRVFISVSARISPVSGASESERKVVFTIEDGSTFVPVPLPLYDSNTGGVQLLYVQIWDNVGGSLIDWFTLSTLVLRGKGSGGVEVGP